MNELQLILLAASGYFAYEVYKHIQTLQDPKPEQNNATVVSAKDPYILEEEADEAYQDGKYEKAYNLLAEAFSIEKNADFVAKMGYIIWQHQKDTQKALEHFKEAIEIEPLNERYYNSVASVYRELKEFENAKKYLEKSLKINPKNAMTYFNYGNLLVDMNESEKAKEQYQKALELDSDFKEAKEELEKL